MAFFLSLGALWRVSRSPFGMALRAIRDNDVRAAFVGIPVRAYRWRAFVLSGAITGLAGGLYGQLDRQVTPEQLGWLFSAKLVVATIIGGTQWFLGPVVGAAVFVAPPARCEPLRALPWSDPRRAAARGGLRLSRRDRRGDGSRARVGRAARPVLDPSGRPMRHRSSAATAALAGLVTLAIVVPARETGAHGGRVQLAKVPAGPYLVSVWTLPDPPRVGSLDVSLAVMEPRTERALLDASAQLTSNGPSPRQTGHARLPLPSGGELRGAARWTGGY